MAFVNLWLAIHAVFLLAALLVAYVPELADGRETELAAASLLTGAAVLTALALLFVARKPRRHRGSIEQKASSDVPASAPALSAAEAADLLHRLHAIRLDIEETRSSIQTFASPRGRESPKEPSLSGR